MKLRTALEIYEREGPHDTTSRVQTAQLIATQAVHMHLTPEESFALVKSWRGAKVEGKGEFFKKLGEVKERLTNMGFL